MTKAVEGTSASFLVGHIGGVQWPAVRLGEEQVVIDPSVAELCVGTMASIASPPPQAGVGDQVEQRIAPGPSIAFRLRRRGRRAPPRRLLTPESMPGFP
ncbi:hypothetical protein [Amycolatopsis solani]|uniref:hypothetical protein n=1 Tax=Amycolatopsis solani TaxID=3028615 RepID=UPI0025AED56D|nr:hypothetical protein [Amycolatopsis sp. MEP2-6]